MEIDYLSGSASRHTYDPIKYVSENRMVALDKRKVVEKSFSSSDPRKIFPDTDADGYLGIFSMKMENVP